MRERASRSYAGSDAATHDDAHDESMSASRQPPLANMTAPRTARFRRTDAAAPFIFCRRA
ncbi:hypothetical protein C6P92_10880 [Burkholderia multivorans]|nr:hypothetical protein C6P91_15920 [Burkholderia multivorans]PRE23392.1 hypothetical protein C6P92_10880 [Burkholderia multivorans]PRF20089.1 hypothetical protein C6Q03_22065 [Burkholderia multivorans]